MTKDQKSANQKSADQKKGKSAGERVVPLRKGGGRCPICSKPAVAAYRPFCSKRCANVDLGRWLGEGYRIPTEEPASPDGRPPAEWEEEEED